MMVLGGMSRLEQMAGNTDYMSRFAPCTQEDYAVLRQVVDLIHQATPVPCTACRYCVDGCPMNIPIPTYFALYNAEYVAQQHGYAKQLVYYTNAARGHGLASQCVGCGQCARSCPQHIDIPEELKKVAQLFENGQ